MRKDYSDNPLANSWRERYDMQSDAIKEKLDALKTMPVSEFQLQVIKKERKFMPEKGDVFVTSPRNSIYFYGVVVNAGIDNNNGNDLLVVMIFKDKTKSLQDINFDVDYNNLLIPPEIVGREYWTKGYFYNIGLNI